MVIMRGGVMFVFLVPVLDLPSRGRYHYIDQ